MIVPLPKSMSFRIIIIVIAMIVILLTVEWILRKKHNMT